MTVITSSIAAVGERSKDRRALPPTSNLLAAVRWHMCGALLTQPRRVESAASDHADERQRQGALMGQGASVLMNLDGVAAAAHDTPRAWVVIEGESPPADWQDRATAAWVVRLVPGEVENLLTERATRPVLDHSQLRLARLVGRGLTTLEIARELRVDHRTAQRQVARLRQQLGARSKAELAVLLAESGL